MLARFETSSITQSGRGTSATVYRAVRRADGKPYAIKVFEASEYDASELRGLLSEALVLASLDHPHIVKFRECFLSSNGSVCVVMELMSGGTLEDFIREQRARREYLPEEAVWRLFLQLASAVKFLHAHSVCHRDLAPKNIMFAEPNTGCLKIVDFGLSKFVGNKLSRTQVGTPCYAAPEVYRWQPHGTPCDVWSLGCILHELAGLQTTFEAGTTEELRRKVLSGRRSPLPHGYSLELRDTVALMLATDPAQRITMDQLLALPQLARRLEALQQEGLVRRSASSPDPAALWSALRKHEAFTTSVAQFGADQHLEAGLLSAVLPPSRYSLDVRAALDREAAQAGQKSKVEAAAQPVLGSKNKNSSSKDGGSTSDTNSSNAAPAASAAEPAASTPQPAQAALPADPAPGSAAAPPTQADASATAAAKPSSAAAAALTADRLAAAMSGLDPRYAGIVAAAQAELARRASGATGGDSPTKGPSSPLPANAAPRSPGVDGWRRPATSGTPRRDSGCRTPQEAAALMRAAVTAGLQMEEDLMIRQMVEKLSRVSWAKASISAGPTPRAAAAAEARWQAQPPRSASIVRTHADSEEVHVRVSSPTRPAVLPLAATQPAQQPRSAIGADTRAADEPRSVSACATTGSSDSETHAGAPTATNSDAEPATCAAPAANSSTGVSTRKWRVFGLLRGRRADKSCAQ